MLVDELELPDELPEVPPPDEPDELTLLDELSPPVPLGRVSGLHDASAMAAITINGNEGPRFFHRI